jgi:hypothetical protein
MEKTEVDAIAVLQTKVQELEESLKQVFAHMHAVNVFLAEKYTNELDYWSGVTHWHAMKTYKEQEARRLADTITELEEQGFVVTKNEFRNDTGKWDPATDGYQRAHV